MKSMRFTTEEVRAILEGRKTMTRRIIKPQALVMDGGYINTTAMTDTHWRKMISHKIQPSSVGVKFFAPYQPGDITWVRETWADLRGMGFGNDPKTDKPWKYSYKADIQPGSDSDRARIDYGVKWRPSIHMPREAARLFLEVKDVRAERLREEDSTIRKQDIDLYGWEANPWVWVVEFEITR